MTERRAPIDESRFRDWSIGIDDRRMPSIDGIVPLLDPKLRRAMLRIAFGNAARSVGRKENL